MISVSYWTELEIHGHRRMVKTEPMDHVPTSIKTFIWLHHLKRRKYLIQTKVKLKHYR